MSELWKSLASVQAEITDVTRDADGQVGNHKYKYADLAQVLKMLRPILKEEKLAVLQSPCIKDGHSVLNTLVVHESGDQHDFGDYPLGEYRKPQELGSAITYARRYSLCAIFGIAQEDTDAKDVESPKPVAAKQSPPLKPRVDKALASINAARTIADIDRLDRLMIPLIKDADGTPFKEDLVECLKSKREALVSFIEQLNDVMEDNNALA